MNILNKYKLIVNAFFYLVLIIFLHSCNATKEDIENTSFSEKEKQTSMNLLKEFDNLLIAKIGGGSIDKAYLTYSNSLKNSKSVNDFLEKEKLYNEQYLKIIDKYKKTDFFKEVWTLKYGFNNNTKDTIIVNLDINPQGRYLDFLNIKSINKLVLKDYIMSIKECNCIPPSIIAGFPNVINEFDINNEEDRLIIAIHYLTILSVM